MGLASCIEEMYDFHYNYIKAKVNWNANPVVYRLLFKEIKKEKGFNKNIADNMSHKEYAYVLFGKKMMRDNIKRLEIKLDRIGYDL